MFYLLFKSRNLTSFFGMLENDSLSASTTASVITRVLTLVKQVFIQFDP